MNLIMEAIAVIFGILFYVGILAIPLTIIKGLRTKKFKLVLPSLNLVLISIILGAIITIAFTGNEAYIANPRCSVPPNQVDCTNLSHGYPRKFISGESFVAVFSKDQVSPGQPNISSLTRISISTKSLVFDLGLWSLVSFAVIYTVGVWTKATPKKKKR